MSRRVLTDEQVYYKLLLILGFGNWIKDEDLDFANEVYKRWSKLSGLTAADIAFAPPIKYKQGSYFSEDDKKRIKTRRLLGPYLSESEK